MKLVLQFNPQSKLRKYLAIRLRGLADSQQKQRQTRVGLLRSQPKIDKFQSRRHSPFLQGNLTWRTYVTPNLKRTESEGVKPLQAIAVYDQFPLVKEIPKPQSSQESYVRFHRQNRIFRSKGRKVRKQISPEMQFDREALEKMRNFKSEQNFNHFQRSLRYRFKR